MEGGGLFLQAILLGGFLVYESYFKEKGKNLATKEDIGKITEEVQSVKQSFDKSLENHKSRLLRDFEESKHIIALCQELDRELVNLLGECTYLSNLGRDHGRDAINKESLKDVLDPLGEFLSKYSNRYSINENARSIIELYEEYTRACQMDEEGEYENNPNTPYSPPSTISRIDIDCMGIGDRLVDEANLLSAYFLPPLPTKKVGE